MVSFNKEAPDAWYSIVFGRMLRIQDPARALLEQEDPHQTDRPVIYSTVQLRYLP
jgi:hypothetical protein